MAIKETKKEMINKINKIDNKDVIEFLNVIIETAFRDCLSGKANELQARDKGVNKPMQIV